MRWDCNLDVDCDGDGDGEEEGGVLEVGKGFGGMSVFRDIDIDTSALWRG